MSHWLDIVVATPAHSSVAGPLTYASESPLAPGQLVRVPLGRREVLGVVWAERCDAGSLSAGQTKSVAAVLDGIDPLSDGWRGLIGFAAGYYQRSLGEVALAALPPQLRELGTLQLARRLKRVAQAAPRPEPRPALPDLSAQQQAALQAFAGAHQPTLLFGATGSGKTEVYLRAAQEVLEAEPDAQVLVMVPEINLTPQLQSRLHERFAHLGEGRVVTLHSNLTPAQRLKAWLAAHSGQARVVLGTRMAVLASLPGLRLKASAWARCKAAALRRLAGCCWARPRPRWRAGRPASRAATCGWTCLIASVPRKATAGHRSGCSTWDSSRAAPCWHRR